MSSGLSHTGWSGQMHKVGSDATAVSHHSACTTHTSQQRQYVGSTTHLPIVFIATASGTGTPKHSQSDAGPT